MTATRPTRSSSAVLGLAALTALLLGAAAAPAHAQSPADDGAGEATGPDIVWVAGPAKGELGPIASIDVPEGFVFAGPEDTRKLMLAMQNPVNGTEMGFVAPQSLEWFVVFEFDEIGYVKDDDRSDLDAEALMTSLREGQEAGNELRAERGWSTLDLVGWMQPPHYDPETNNLEWGTHLRSSDGEENVNYNSRLLGRRGVMSAILVGSEQDVKENLVAFREVLAGHQFSAGQRYAEFRDGDKIAKYGLAALVTGGAAAVALKTGLLQKFWKLIVIGLAALAGLAKKLFGRKSERVPDGSDQTPA